MKRSFWVFLVAAGLSACSKPDSAPQSELPPPVANITVSGQIYITTKGGANIELGSVPVLLLRMPAAETEFKTRQADWDTKHDQAIELLSKTKTDIQDWESQIKTNDERMDELSRKNAEAWRLAVQQRQYVTTRITTPREGSNILAALQHNEAALVKFREEAAKLARETPKLREQILQSKEGIVRLEAGLKEGRQMTWLLTNWTGIVEQTSTDSQGRFAFTAPQSDYAVVATSSRTITGSDEYYGWFVRVEKTNIILNNLNCIIERQRRSP